MPKVTSKERELLAKLKIAEAALTQIEKVKGTSELGDELAEIARRAKFDIKFDIKHYRTFTQTHDVEED